jgi:hypothetical protein
MNIKFICKTINCEYKGKEIDVEIPESNDRIGWAGAFCAGCWECGLTPEDAPTS